MTTKSFSIAAVTTGPDRPLVSFALATFVIIGLLIFVDTGARTLSLLIIGAGLGAVFWMVQFGFASGWRRFLTVGDTEPMLAQFLLLALITALIMPTLQNIPGSRGAVAPLTLSLPLGACLFGIGMQLANGCGSGALFSLGGGSGRMIIVLPFFVIGSLIGSFILPSALELGGYDAVLIGAGLGSAASTALNLLIIAGVTSIIYVWGRYKGVSLSFSTSLLTGTIVIAILCWLCVVIAGHPWGVTFGFTLWGAKIWQSIGGDLSGAAFWSWPGPARALKNSVLADVSSIMDIGMVLGALLVSACLGGRGSLRWPDFRQMTAAVLGGLLMGIGARLAFGCNIGAFLGGVASGSLHGWLWFVCAIIGNWIGIRMRPQFGMHP